MYFLCLNLLINCQLWRVSPTFTKTWPVAVWLETAASAPNSREQGISSTEDRWKSAFAKPVKQN